jgi:hypothetical protein
MKISNILGKMILTLVLSLFLYGKGEVKLELFKQTVYLGEPFKISIIHSYKEKDRVLKREFEEFISKDFWLQSSSEVKIKKEDDTTFERYDFIVSALKYGTLVLDKQHLRVSHRDPKTNFVKWRDLYTDEVFVEVLPLPKDTTIVGEFSIEATVDTDTIDENKPINLTMRVKGYGNFNDIKNIEIDLPNQTLFKAKPKVQNSYKNNKNYGEFTQIVSIISDQDYTIPLISLKYFNLETKSLQTTTSKAIKVQITNKTPKKLIDFSNSMNYIAIVLGVVLGILISWVFLVSIKYRKRKIENSILKEKIKNSKNDKELYNLLLPYCNEERLKEKFKKLEENIFEKKNHTIDKKDI